METQTDKPWHAIRAGGAPHQVWDGAKWHVPTFATHDECNKWWDTHARKTGDAAWAITDRQRKEGN